MCGIAGMALPGARRPDRGLLERMAACMVHRGPDEDGFLLRDGIGFAFRRLRVLDLHTGSQPQSNEDGSVHVVCNGEIYNHVSLRKDLVARGHGFRTRSDTEVLVHLYEEKGPELVHELNGMFAFAIWDSRREMLLLARDRIGIKPLLYAPVRDGLAFASETGCLLRVDGVDTGIDPVAVNQYLAWGAVPAPRTIHRGVRRLPPGHLLLWRRGNTTVREYWHPLEDAGDQPVSYEAARERLRELLEDSVRLRMVSDVPLGAFLSGGVDSTAIVGLMSRQASDLHTFSIGFANDPVHDESPYAREAAAFHGTRHVESLLRADDVRRVIPRVLDALAEPFGDVSILPTYIVSRETRRHMTVALSGDGADELFAGYNKYLGEFYRSWYGRVPRPVRRGILDPAIRSLPASRHSRLGELGRKARRFLEGCDGNAAERHDRWMRFATPAEVAALLGEDRATNPGLEVIRALHADYDGRGLADPLNRILYTDLRLALPADMLLKVDAASMLHSLEVRLPFLDHRVVSLVLAMPGSWKMRGTTRKRILKDAVSDLLPTRIRNRPKAGFDVPVDEWLKSSMRDLFWDTVGSGGAIPLRRSLLEKWYEEHRQGHAYRAKILWAVFVLRWWESRRTSRPAPGPPAHPVEVAG